MSKVVIYGASRQGIVALEVLRAQGNSMVLGFLDDDPSKHGSVVHGVTVLGGMDWANENAQEDIAAIVAIGNNDRRVAVGARLRAHGMAVMNLVHPSAVIMPGVTMGAGNLVCAGAILVTGTCVEDYVVVNTGATIDHDCVLRTGAYVSPGVHTAGCVTIGKGAFVGVGTTLGPNVTVGEGCVVGAGAVVLSDLPPRVLAYGTPARAVRKLKDTIDWGRILAGE